MSSGPSSTPASGLLALPSEIRNSIYRHTLLAGPKELVELRNLRVPSLLCTSHQILREAAPVFFENKFSLTIVFEPGAEPYPYHVRVPPWINFLQNTIPAAVQIRHVRLEVDHMLSWTVLSIAPARSGRLYAAEAWAQTGAHMIPMFDMWDLVDAYLDRKTVQRIEVEGDADGLSFREVVLVCDMMVDKGIGSVVPV